MMADSLISEDRMEGWRMEGLGRGNGTLINGFWINRERKVGY